jgi:hypothetical protein
VTSQHIDSCAPRPTRPSDAEAVGVEDDHHRGVRHVDANLDDGGGNEHVEIACTERLHDGLLLGTRHPAV